MHHLESTFVQRNRGDEAPPLANIAESLSRAGRSAAVDGISTNHATNKGSTALTTTSEKGHEVVVRALLAVDRIVANHTNAVAHSCLICRTHARVPGTRHHCDWIRIACHDQIITASGASANRRAMFASMISHA